MSSQKRVRLTGVVVNAVTGEGVSKAKVDAFGGENQSVFTGPDGRFEIADVPEGQWHVMARKPGYFSDQEMARGPFQTKTFLVTENSGDITLKLTPAGTITGHVVEEGGEPLEAAEVLAIARGLENGRRMSQPRANTQTDDDGEFTMSGLAPGDYYLRVKPARDATARIAGHAFDDVYEGCYYPAAGARDQGAILHVVGGQQTEADFTLPRARGYRISGRVAMQGNSFRVVVYAIRGEDYDASTTVGQDGRFRLSGLTPGQYAIRALFMDSNQPAFGEELVNVSQADVTNVLLTMQQPEPVPVQIQVVKTKDQRGGQNATAAGGGVNAQENAQRFPLGTISLRPERGQSFGPQYAQVNPNNLGVNDAVAIKGAFPGRYRASAQAFPPYYIESMRSGNVDLLDQALTIAQGGAVAPIQITVRDDSANLSVKVVEEGQPASGGVVLVIPATHPEADDYPRFWGGGNLVQVGPLAPGDYRVYAFDSIENLEYANPEALRAFAGQSQEVTLEPNGQTTVTVEAIQLSKQRSVP